MAYSVVLYTATKKENSTAQPAGIGVSVSCKLKDGSSIINPTIVVDFSTIVGATPAAYNIAYISDFSRYYWIRDVKFVFGVWEYTLKVDALASFKSAIGNTNSYIYRANTGTTVSSFIDNNYPFTAYESTVNSYPAANPFVNTMPNGTYVLGLTGQGGGVGGVSYMAFNNTAFAELASLLFNNSNWLNISDISDNLAKALFNPMQYIQSVMWFPIPYSSITGTEWAKIHFGWWEFDLTSPNKYKALTITGGQTWVTGSFYIPLPIHPAYNEYGREMKLSPATRYTAIILPWGEWEIDPLDVVESDRVVCDYICDLVTGQAFLLTGSYEYDGDNYHTRWFDSRQAKVGVSIAINQTTQDVIGGTIGMVSGAALLASKGAGTTLAGIGAVKSAVDQTVPKSSTSGGQGNVAFYNIMPRIIGQFVMPGARDYTQFGTPVMETRQISSFSGYVKCNPVFMAACTKEEMDEINGHFINGFYYE